MKIVNGKIVETFLGFEDHGIFTFIIFIEIEHYRQGFGLYAIESASALKQVLSTVGVKSWEELKDKYVRVKYLSDEYCEKIHAIGHIMEEKWFSFEDKDKQETE